MFEVAGIEQGLGWDVGQQGGGDRPASTAYYAVNSNVEATLQCDAHCLPVPNGICEQPSVRAICLLLPILEDQKEVSRVNKSADWST